MIKKLVRISLILPIILNSLSFSNADTPEDASALKKFVVTAYYSPLPDQSFYLKGNYDDEIRLNWEGKRWASWKEVYAWMLAAPKTYSFWTKIFFDWLWIWTVDDRWWAIVWSWSRWYDCDRIDIWMWYWEEGLKRALTWWKRTVYWRIISEDEWLESISLDDFKIWKIDIESLRNSRFVWKNTPDFSQNIKVPLTFKKWSSKDEIKLWYTILAKLWYYKWEISDNFTNDAIDAIIGFQLDNKIVSSTKEKWAWNYWPKTKEVLLARYQEFLEKEKAIIAQEEELEKKAKIVISNLKTPKDNEVWVHVRKLQKTLKTLGYFKSKDTAIFWKQTKDSLIRYQIDKWIIKDAKSELAWKLDESTLKVLKVDIKSVLKSDKTFISYLDV